MKLVEVCVIVPDGNEKECERQLLNLGREFGFVTSQIVRDNDENRNKFFTAGLDE